LVVTTERASRKTRRVQLPHSVLPPTEGGLLQLMTYQRFFVFAVAAGLFAGAAQIVVAHLDTVTATQCRTHDWPVEMHDAHMDFCNSYGYPSN